MYPPHTPDAFVALQDAINNSEFDDVKRNCLLYYLLKAWNDNRSALFAQAKAIPRQYVILSDGYYHLDTGSLEVSAALLFLKFPGGASWFHRWDPRIFGRTNFSLDRMQ